MESQEHVVESDTEAVPASSSNLELEPTTKQAAPFDGVSEGSEPTPDDELMTGMTEPSNGAPDQLDVPINVPHATFDAPHSITTNDNEHNDIFASEVSEETQTRGIELLTPKEVKPQLGSADDKTETDELIEAKDDLSVEVPPSVDDRPTPREEALMVDDTDSLAVDVSLDFNSEDPPSIETVEAPTAAEQQEGVRLVGTTAEQSTYSYQQPLRSDGPEYNDMLASEAPSGGGDALVLETDVTMLNPESVLMEPEEENEVVDQEPSAGAPDMEVSDEAADFDVGETIIDHLASPEPLVVDPMGSPRNEEMSLIMRSPRGEVVTDTALSHGEIGTRGEAEAAVFVRALRKQFSAEDGSSGLKRPHSSAKLELSTAKEDAIRNFVNRGIDLEQEFLSLCDSKQRRLEVHLVQQLLAGGGTAKMLGTFFEMLVSMSRSEEASDYELLPRLIRSARIGISVRSRGPSRTFCFSGKGTCIEISGTSTFAKSFPSAWGFCAWIWLAATACPFTVVSFLTKERYGISVTLIPPDDQDSQAATLLFESADEKKRNGLRVAIPANQLKLRTWHHLYICHTRKKAGYASGTVVVRIDDRIIEEKPLGFPGLGLTSPVTRARVMDDFDGFAGPIWILDGALKSPGSLARQQVTVALAEGEEAAPGLGVFVTRADQEPYPPVFASYYPERTLGKLCMDLHGSHLGTLLNACVPWCVITARDSLRAVGGPAVLLPFFHTNAKVRDPVVTSEIIMQTILLLGSLLEGHTPNQNEFFESQGVSLLTHALEILPQEVRLEMLRDPTRDLVNALGSLARAFGLDAIGTSNEGTRLMRMMNWRSRSVEFELDKQLVLALDFWIRFSGAVSRDLLLRVVGLCAKRVAERPSAYRKKFGARYLIDIIRKLYEQAEEFPDESSRKAARAAGTAFVDTVIAPILTDAATPITREEVRAVLDACIGAGHGSSSESSDPLRDRRRSAAWDEPTMELAHDALRLLIRLFQQPTNHAVLSGSNIPAILAVEVVAFGGLGERIRALALRVIGLSLASSHAKDAADSLAAIGGFSYLSSALSCAVIKGERRFAATGGRSGSFDETAGPVTTYSSQGLGSPKLPQQRKSLSSAFASARPFFVGASPPGSFSASLRKSRPGVLTPSSSGRPLSETSQAGTSDTTPFARTFLPADVATSNVLSEVPASAHIGDATYNALLSMVVTPTSISPQTIGTNRTWRRAVLLSLSDEDDSAESVPQTVLDDVMKIANVHALSLLLDQLGHMSPLVQQRMFQDLFVLLKFEQDNRKVFCTIPNWQRTLAAFLSTHGTGEKVGVFEMGIKLWVLLLHDTVLREPDALLDVYWFGESFGKQVADAVFSGLLESLDSLPNAPSAPVIEALIKMAELSPVHYREVLDLIDPWKRLPELAGPYFALLVKETCRIIAREQADMAAAVRSAKRAYRLLSSVSSSLAQSFTAGGENLFRDAAICAVVRVHECLERFQGQTEFASQEEKDFLDNCALTLLEASRVLGFQANKDSRAETELLELAAAMAPNKGKPMPRAAWLHSRWAMNPLDPGFASLSEATLDDLSFSIKRTDRGRYDAKFATEHEKLGALARARGDMENAVRDSEERFVYAELARLTSLMLANLNEKTAVKDRWASLIKEMANGETVWKNPSLDCFWMCPDREDFLRRHLVMEKNLNGVSHDDAAYESSLQNAAANYTPPTLPLPVTQDPVKDAEEEDAARHLRKKEVTVPFDAKEEICYVAEGARWVTPSIVLSGRVEVSALHVMFYAADLPEGSSASEEQKRKQAKKRQRWRLDELVEIHSRRYLLRPTAIELFFSDRTTAFFAFQTQAIRDECSSQILRQKPARLEKAFTGSLAPPAQVFKRSKLTEMWRRREISNFEYLMRLNTIAGRTYNDVTQFFVFPWILTDYESEEINLDDFSKFRDLTKPVGALNPQREAEVRERYHAFTESDMGMPPFHHGSHYSSAGVVLHYLIRVEPYTTLAIELQGGRFDVPDRLFYSIKDCFKSCYSSVVDCRELIPEFFYLSEMFVNKAKVPLGRRQDGNLVDNVRLPPWAQNDPERFVRMNRESLESEYVSESLHNWIDLIFGYKQRGKDAVEACNVFNHLSYEGAVDLEAISDPGRRAAVELQILEFGQCPSQLLTHPHPKRMSLNELGRSIASDLVREAFYSKSAFYKWNMLVWRKVAWQASTELTGGAVSAGGAVVHGVVATALTPVKQVQSLVKLFGGGASTPSSLPSTPSTPPPSATTVVPPPVVSLTAFDDRIVLVHADLTATVMHIAENSSDSASLELRPGLQTILPSAQAATYVTARPRDAGLVGTNLGQSLRGRPHDFVASQGGNLIISSPYFDGSIRCFRMDGTKLETNVVGHRGRVTALAHDGRWLISGSADGTAVLWRVGGSHDSRDEMLELFGEGTGKTGGQGPLLRVERFLTGHCAAVSCVAVSQLIGILVTGAQDGSLILHALYDRSPAKARKLETGWKTPVDSIAVCSGSGGIVAHSRANMELIFFSVNGQLLGRVTNDEPWNFCEIVSFHEQDVIIGGGDKSGEIWIRRTPDLQVTRKISYAKRYRGVRCAGVAPNGKYIFIGCADGSVIALGDGTGLQMDIVGGSAEGGKKGVIVSE